MTLKTVFDKLSEEMILELESILEFWSNHSVDNQHGGFVGQIDHYGKINLEASKGAVLNTRLLWTFSAACRMIGSKKLEMLATRAFEYLLLNFWDKENGGLFWKIDCNGKPLNTRKQAYAQGFGVYALSEYYLATGNTESLDYAKKLFRIIEERFRDTDKGGYTEALDKEWKPLADMRLSERDANYPKSMNTHLHILEPYTNLYRVWKNEEVKESILHLLDVFQTKIVNAETGHFNLFFEMDWTCRSEIVSYGHDIEGAWLLHEAAHEISASDIIKSIQETALKLVDVTLDEGRDADGSLFNERERDHLDTDKHWWPQAEAMVGLMDAWEISKNDAYIHEIERIWKFVKENVIDYENGEWYGRVDINKNAIPENKVGFWKCPYHNTRAMIELITRFKKQLD
ncbi:AGE family epimerase/isomerase [Prolixibacteraceae bacterium Z1-6]|uniref:Cellobiose 2-epimerase n=1 Tax=Draconibacterium aestuarii TaxID=2998507 RepID=A0A9X3J6R2_9BACT|nr:AGE family epimerase/isomerase [Prolixibacteraceae bacterium Z1-6]